VLSRWFIALTAEHAACRREREENLGLDAVESTRVRV
jgi:hypothetical protein